jgi:hypothetical protein
MGHKREPKALEKGPLAKIKPELKYVQMGLMEHGNRNTCSKGRQLKKNHAASKNE